MASMSRREMMRRALLAAAGAGAGFGSLAGRFGLAQARTGPVLRGAGSNYRALVCVYLYGGNDCFNMVVPRGAGHAVYAATRGGLAVPLNQLLPLAPAVAPQGGGEWGLHPVMTGLRDLFNAGDAAIIATVGPLVRPVNKAMLELPSTPLPPQLFSHSDQSVVWQTPRADTSNRTGWGGLLADEFAGSNANPTLSMNVSLEGDNVFQAGRVVSPYFMSAYGVEQIDPINTGAADCSVGPNGYGWNRRRCESFAALLAQSQPHPFQRAYVGKAESTIATSAMVRAAIESIPDSDPVFAPFRAAFGLPGSATAEDLPYLARQLLTVARMVMSRDTLQMSRQTFFTAIGGFDTHDNQLADHPDRLREVSQSIKAFHDVMTSLGLSDSVTTFTASEFGRTLSSNGDGTDHGWGGHHFVVGGAVNGARIYGRMPNLSGDSDNNPDDAGWGQIIPTLSVDQYAATLCQWFGLDPLDRDFIFPNLQHMTGAMLSIAGPDLGFMAPA